MNAAGIEWASVSVASRLGNAIDTTLILSPSRAAVGDFVGADDLFRSAIRHVAVSLNPLSGNNAPLNLRAADKHLSTWIRV